MHIPEAAWAVALNTLTRMARGRVQCRRVQREAFAALIEIKKHMPHAVSDSDLKSATERLIIKESQNANKGC